MRSVVFDFWGSKKEREKKLNNALLVSQIILTCPHHSKMIIW